MWSRTRGLLEASTTKTWYNSSINSTNAMIDICHRKACSLLDAVIAEVAALIAKEDAALSSAVGNPVSVKVDWDSLKKIKAVVASRTYVEITRNVRLHRTFAPLCRLQLSHHPSLARSQLISSRTPLSRTTWSRWSTPTLTSRRPWPLVRNKLYLYNAAIN